jgi:iron complex outermembrane receptor protein
MRHDIQFGADYEYRKIYRADLLRQATTSTFNYLNPVYGLERPSTTVSASDSDQTDALHNRALFLQDNIRLTDKWLLMGGVRYLSYSQVAGRGRPFVTNTDTSGNKLLPKAGLVYKWTSDLSLYTSYTQSLKPTSTIAPFGTGVVIDSSIAPEESKAYEIGAKVDIPGKITGTLALFNIKKRNVLVSQFNDVTKLVDYHTAGAARSRGVELDVSGAVTDQLSLIGSYAYIDARTTEDPLYQGLRLWNVAKHTASLWGVYDFGTIVGGDRLRAGGGVRYVGARPGDSANSFELPAYTVADVFTSYNTKISGRNVKFQLNVKNLFNRLYYPSSANRNFVSMGDARQVMFSTMLEF